MVACVQLLESHSAGKPIFEKCNIGRCFRELFECIRKFGIWWEVVVAGSYSTVFANSESGGSAIVVFFKTPKGEVYMGSSTEIAIIKGYALFSNTE